MSRGTPGHRVVFHPSGESGTARPGETLLQVALRLGVALRHVCGGNANCTTCRVQVKEGPGSLTAPTEKEAGRLPDERLASGWRLSCQARVHGPVAVRIPSLIERIREASEFPTEVME